MKFKIQIIVTLLTLFCCVKSSRAQVPDSIRFLQEISRIQASFSDSGGLAFKSIYYYESTDVEYVVYDTMTASYLLKGELMSFSIDNFKMVQNDQYQVVVYELDSLMQINRPADINQNIIQANFYDSLFYQMNVSGVSISNNGTNRIMNFTFLGNSPYVKYEISYDSLSYKLNSVEYRVKQVKSSASGSSFSGPYSSLKIVFFDYVPTQVSDDVFSPNQFFIRQNGILTAVSPYAGFSIINQTVED